jgi:hypothetical protein
MVSADTLAALLDPAALSRAVRPVPLYPAADDPAWRTLREDVRRPLLSDADALLAAEPWPALTLHDWLDFTRSGTRSTFEGPYFVRRRQTVAAALALALDPGPVRLDALQDRVWDLVLEASWCVPGHHTAPDGTDLVLPDPARPRLDLFAAETGALLGWVLALHGDALVADLADQVRREVHRRVLDPFRDDARGYHWFALPSNWNPWVVSNVVAATLTTGHPDAGAVLTTAVESLDAYLTGVPQDGGCPEGIAYWWQSAARFFEALDLLTRLVPEARDAVMALPLLGRLARYPLAVHLGGGPGASWNAVFGDGSAVVPRRDEAGWSREAHSPALLHRLGRAVADEQVTAFACAQRGDDPPVPLPSSLHRALAALFDPRWAADSAQGRDRDVVLPPRVWLPEVAVLSAGTGGLRVVAKGGHNGEPHNHNDVGSVVVGADGVPVVVDAGSGRYTRDSFRSGRYDAWFTTSAFHGVPEVDGVAQRPGREYAATVVEVGDDHVTFDLAGAYPSGVVRWWRTIVAAGGQVELRDAWDLDHDPRDVVLRLLLTGPPEVLDAGTLGLRGPVGGGGGSAGRGRGREGDEPVAVLRHAGAAASLRRLDQDDPLLRGTWGSSLTLLELRPAPARSGELVVTVEALSRAGRTS